MKEADYPDLFQSADKAALAAQRQYVSVFFLDLVLLVGAGAFALFRSVTTGDLSWIMGIVSAVSMLASIICKLVMRVRRFDRIWFDCRAIAESVKTTAWRYMMCVPPFNTEKSPATSDQELVTELESIRKARPSVIGELAAYPSDSDRITPTMRHTRQLSLSDRKRKYLKERLKDQKEWYRSKAKINADAADKSFWVIIWVQTFAFVLGVVEVVKPKTPNMVAVIVSVAAIIIAWNEMKRYKDLANAYTIAADDLASAEAVWEHIADEKELQKQVIQTEDAISREHTMWLVRRTS